MQTCPTDAGKTDSEGGHNRRKVRVRAALLRPAHARDTAKRASAELYAAAVRTIKNL